ncbi:phage tail protein [Clostridium botulinum]|nr:phage tail protein [Clostridium botulinum]
MAEKFYSILTNIGKAKVANSIGLGTKINFAKMKVGDGGGSYYEPTESQTDLKYTVWEGNINHVTVDEKNPNWIHIEVMIPSTVGGFTIREYGAFDDENNLIGICKCAETYKPVIADGSTKELLLDLILCVVNTDTVELKIDPTIIFAKKGEVEQLRTDITAQLKEIANKVDNIKIADGTTTTKGIVQLNNTTNSTSITQAATANAVKLAMDRANEAFTGADNYKKGIAGVIGSPVLDTQNKDEAVNSIQGIKNNAASALKSKNVDASGNEALASLVAKIANITIESLGGKKLVIGTITATSNSLSGSITLNFKPNLVVITGAEDGTYNALFNSSELPIFNQSKLYYYKNSSINSAGTSYGEHITPSDTGFSFKLALTGLTGTGLTRTLTYYAFKI